MRKLLIADDEITLREYVKYVIREHKLAFDIYEAANGMDTVQMAQEIDPDLILLDISMPRMNGLEAAAVIKRNGSACRIVILTAYESFEYARTALRTGIDDYLLKPIAPEALLNCLGKEPPGTGNEPAVLPDRRQLPLSYSAATTEKAKLYIRENLERRIRVEEVAAHVHLSPYYFSRCFKRKTGFLFTEYVNRIRIDRAKEYIRTCDLPLWKIAELVGFEDWSYFSSVFKKYSGLLPSDFRSSLKE